MQDYFVLSKHFLIYDEQNTQSMIILSCQYDFSSKIKKIHNPQILFSIFIASKAKRARKRALSHVVVDEFHLQNLKVAITRKLSILEACCIEQNVFVCTCFTHIWYNFCHPEQKSTRPDPTRPSRFWAAYYSKTMSFREKNYETKNIGLYHKSYVLKFGGVPLCSL